MARLRHPNIVPVHDVGREGSTCFIVGEWIEGTNLAARIRDVVSYTGSRPGSWPRSPTPWATPTPRVTSTATSSRRNILIDSQGRAYLTDFGIAVVEEDLLRDVTAAGTLPYMAPEQLDDELGPVDHRADIYALGVVLYELLTGRRPFRAATPIELREQILGTDPPPPRSIEPDVPAVLERICLRCLAKNPDDRYPPPMRWRKN